MNHPTSLRQDLDLYPAVQLNHGVPIKMNYSFTFQPDVATDTGDEGVITNDFNFTEAMVQGVMTAVIILFTPPNDDTESYIVVDQLRYHVLMVWLNQDANWNSNDKDWVSFAELLLGQVRKISTKKGNQ